MSKREYKGKALPNAVPDSLSQLPVEQPIAVYYRQSTDAQIGNVSTTMQTVDMVEYLKTRGWDDTKIAMIDMDGGVSGTKKIDQRPGMRALFELIVGGQIGAVACQDEDRLFRDVTQIQVNVFIEACRAAHVLVLTPTMVYDFAHPQMGQFHARQFRFKCEMAAEFITSYIRGRLYPAKMHLMREGKWAGGTLPPGFMLDVRKTLPDGSENALYRRYVAYPPHADIILSYFRMFLENAGNLTKTHRQIVQHGAYFPDPKTWLAPKGYRFLPPRTMKNGGNGFCPGKDGLRSILTNAAYIGHWSVNDVIVRWNNHPAIIPLDMFMEAFNYLSQITLDGLPNRDYKPFFTATRPTKDVARPVERPLCAGMIFTEVAGKWKKAGTYYQTKWERYAYTVLNPPPLETVLWWKKASYVDEQVERLVRDELAATFNSEAWDTAMESYARDYHKDIGFKMKQRSTLEHTMQNLLTSLETLTHAEMIRNVERRYAETQAEHERLSEDIATAQSQVAQVEALTTLKGTLEPALADWEHLKRDRKRAILHTFIERIEATVIEPKVLEFVICWRGGNANSFIVGRRDQRSVGWRPSESAALLALVDAGASQVEIAAYFPSRKWHAIHNKVWALRGKGSLQLSPHPIADYETYRDFQRRAIRPSTNYKARGGERWTDAAIATLKQMVAQGATQVEIAAAFPHRNWARLRATITKACGNDVKIPGAAALNGLAGEIHKHETYAMYLARTQPEAQEQQSSGEDEPPDEPDEDTLGGSSSQHSSERGRRDGQGSLRRGAASSRRRPARRARWYGAARETDAVRPADDDFAACQRLSKCV